MRKSLVLCLLLSLFVPIAFSISIRDLISRYSFSTSSQEINVTNQIDFMVDKNNNGINDTLVFELTAKNSAGTFIFVANLFDKNGVITDEANFTLSAGTNKLNITLDANLLNQNQFNYSIKVYNSSYSLKYRKDSILTQNYQNYESGFEILNIQDSRIDNALIINATINSTINSSFETILFLSYNNSIISIKENKSITNDVQDLIFKFDNETIKKTHYVGSFNLSSLKIGRKIIKTSFATVQYDFRDFAVSSYIYNFNDNGIDLNGNDKFDILQVTANAHISQDDYYTIIIGLYDLFDNLVGIENATNFLNAGSSPITVNFNGSNIYKKKLNGPFVIKYARLFQNGVLVDKMNNAYTTKNYNSNDFEIPNLPDLAVDISVSEGYKFGINNATINIAFRNIGNKPAFNVFTEIFDNNTFSRSNKSNILGSDSEILYTFNFTNFSDFEITAIADLQNFIDELNESNNAKKLVIALNKNLASENDADDDGINDSIDKLIGDKNSINTSTINLAIFLGDSTNLSRQLNETTEVRFFDNNLTIAEFNFDFSLYKLNLTSIAIEKQLENSTGSLIVKGLKMPPGFIKTLYLDKINTTVNGICVKDEEISAISEISDNCRLNNEFKIECDSTLQNSYICTYNSTLNKYKVQGLRHSGIMQIDYTKPTMPTSSSTSASSASGLGSSGGVGCVSSWHCNEWSECVDGFQKRKCFDANQCAFPTKKPNEIQECIYEETKENAENIIPISLKTENQTKKSVLKDLGRITGQIASLNSSEKGFSGIFNAMALIIALSLIYLTIRVIFSKNL